MLVLCATPIGNLGDITERVLKALREADLIAAEDTRNTRTLLTHFGIHTPLTSYHEHNKYEKAETLLGKLREGLTVAVVTDAGTPAISDPGEVLVRRCIEEGIRVTSLPGACALITALTMSGLSARRFVFEGFLPADRKERQEVLSSLAAEERTCILYEAPHRLRKTAEELLESLGDRRAVFCRELTKRFEEALPMTLSEAVAYYGITEPRGEYVLVIAGADRAERVRRQQAEWASLSVADHVQQYIDEGLDRKEAMRRAALDRGVSRREIYQEYVNLRNK